MACAQDLCNSVALWHSERVHKIQRPDSQQELGALVVRRAGGHAVSKDRFEAKHRGLGKGTAVIV